MRMAKMASVVLLLCLPIPAAAADWFVSPGGSPANPGTPSAPWSLDHALSHPGAVRPGDTLWLRGGVYRGFFTSRLTGAPGAPIRVRQCPGERATIDGGAPEPRSPLTVEGAWAWYWGFEIMNSQVVRASAPRVSTWPAGLTVRGANTKILNLVVHDTHQGVGLWSGAVDAELYGCLLYHNGWEASDRGHGHATYVQNATGQKRIVDNIFFNHFSMGHHAYGERGAIHNILYEGNISFNNGILSRTSGLKTNVYSRSAVPARNVAFISNYSYFAGEGAGRNWNIANAAQVTIRNNYIAGGHTAIRLGDGLSGIVMTGNTIWGALDGFSGAQYPGNAYHAARPAGVATFVRPNRYEPGRAHVAVFNWDRRSTVQIPLADAGLGEGDAFEVRDAQNFFGDPVAAGVVRGPGAVAEIPMTGLKLAPPIGHVPVVPPHTAPEFGAFVILKTRRTGGVSSAPLAAAATNGASTPPSTTAQADGAPPPREGKPETGGDGLSDALVSSDPREGTTIGTVLDVRAGTRPIVGPLLAVRIKTTDGQEKIFCAAERDGKVFDAAGKAGAGDVLQIDFKVLDQLRWMKRFTTLGSTGRSGN